MVGPFSTMAFSPADRNTYLLPGLQALLAPSESILDPMHATDLLIGLLYRSALRKEPGTFRHWALRQLHDVMDFDAAL